MLRAQETLSTLYKFRKRSMHHIKLSLWISGGMKMKKSQASSSRVNHPTHSMIKWKVERACVSFDHVAPTLLLIVKIKFSKLNN